MTIGSHLELLTLGYLKNQGFFEAIEAIKIVQVDWETEAVAVVTHNKHSDFSEQLVQRTVTTGCGQGTVFGRLMEKLKQIRVPEISIKQSTIYALLEALREQNQARSGATQMGLEMAQQSGVTLISRAKATGNKNPTHLTCLFVRLGSCCFGYIACYAPCATRSKTNNNSSQNGWVIYFQLPKGKLL